MPDRISRNKECNLSIGGCVKITYENNVVKEQSAPVSRIFVYFLKRLFYRFRLRIWFQYLGGIQRKYALYLFMC